MSEEDKTNPSYYRRGKIEVIDFIEDQGLGFHLGNAIKYICRSDHKGDGRTDIEKAIWCLKRYLREDLGNTGGMAEGAWKGYPQKDNK